MPDSLPPWVGAVLFGWIFVGFMAALFIGRICAVNQREDDEPYRNKDDWGM